MKLPAYKARKVERTRLLHQLQATITAAINESMNHLSDNAVRDAHRTDKLYAITIGLLQMMRGQTIADYFARQVLQDDVLPEIFGFMRSNTEGKTLMGDLARHFILPGILMPLGVALGQEEQTQPEKMFGTVRMGDEVEIPDQ